MQFESYFESLAGIESIIEYTRPGLVPVPDFLQTVAILYHTHRNALNIKNWRMSCCATEPVELVSQAGLGKKSNFSISIFFFFART